MTSQLADTKWPEAVPLDGEEILVTISCGNSHLNWATHLGVEEDFNPHIFWRTPLLKEEDLKQEDPIAILSKNLPDEPHDYIFGISRDASSENAAEQSKMRKAPKISVYVVSTNRAKAVLLAEIWKTVPSRFFVMTGDDFFKREEGRYDTMGTDRLATLTGAVHLHGHPALVFDGGTATTYSATDSDGKIMGGGIGPGIQSKFRSLRNDTDALPEISSEEVLARVKEAQEDGKPLPTFARNTQEAMIVDNFQEFALKGRNVIEQWLEKAYKETTPAGGTMVNADRRVLCTGGDGDILMQLLQPHHGGLIEHIRSDGEKSNNKTSSKRYEVESSKHLIHYGIACVLLTQYSRLRKGKKLPSYGEHIGKRVAKYFNVEADDGDNIFRGNVVAVIEVEGEDPDFRIKYDDGDSEDVTIDELAVMFKTYTKHGEKKLIQPVASKRASNSRKKNDAALWQEEVKPTSHATSQNASPDDKVEAVPANLPNNEAAFIPLFPMKPNSGRYQSKKPAAKKAKTGDDVAALVHSSDPHSFVRKRVSKDFDGSTYFGTIMEYDTSENPAFWHIEYDDGDEEDYSKKDLIQALRHYAIHGKYDSD